MKIYLVLLFLITCEGGAKDDESCFRAWRGCYADIQLPTTQTVFLPEWSDEIFERTCRNISNIVECSELVEECERYRKNMNLAIDRAMVWVCEEGFQEFKTNRKCFTEKNDDITMMTSHCSQTLDKNLNRIKNSKQHNVEIVNEFCRELNKTMSCYVSWVDELCGSSAAKWFVMFNDNLINEHSTFLRCSEINPGDTTMTKLVFAAILLCVLIVPALILVCLIMYRKRKLRMSQSTSTINAPRSTRSSPLSHTRHSSKSNHHGNTESSRQQHHHHHHSSFKQNNNSQRHLKSRYQRQSSDKPSNDAQNSSAPLINSAKSSKDEDVLVLEMGQFSDLISSKGDNHTLLLCGEKDPPNENKHPEVDIPIQNEYKESTTDKQLHDEEKQISNESNHFDGIKELLNEENVKSVSNEERSTKEVSNTSNIEEVFDEVKELPNEKTEKLPDHETKVEPKLLFAVDSPTNEDVKLIIDDNTCTSNPEPEKTCEKNIEKEITDDYVKTVSV